MKEYPDKNFRIKVEDLLHFEGTALHKHLPDVLIVTINEIVRVAIGKSIAFHTWPPEHSTSFDEWESTSEALLYVFNLVDLSVGVSDVEAMYQTERVDGAHAWLCLQTVDFSELYEDVCDLTNQTVTLRTIEGRPLADFLTRRLPESPLNDYQRRILCLD